MFFRVVEMKVVVKRLISFRQPFLFHVPAISEQCFVAIYSTIGFTWVADISFWTFRTNTAFTQSAAALIKIFAPQVRRLIEGGAYLKIGHFKEIISFNLTTYMTCKKFQTVLIPDKKGVRK